MLGVELAVALRAAGFVWRPAKGDRFVIPERDLDGVEFVVSDLVIEVQQVGDGGEVLAFNGTTEWALDSIEVEEAVWLPREDQLRDLLGPSFERLERIDGAAPGFAVVARGVRHVDVSAENAYARAVLDVT